MRQNLSINTLLFLIMFLVLGSGCKKSSNNEAFTDPRDGNVYKIITIGEQVWMAENLRYLPNVVGSGTGSETKPYHYVYGYEGTSVPDAKATTSYETYGVLYNWPAAMNACPDGWHLPSDSDWTDLTDYLEYYTAGGELKATGTIEAGTGLWEAPNTGATNKSGFTAIPGGARFGDEFGHIGRYGYWWSDTEGSAGGAWDRTVSNESGGLFRDSWNYNKVLGFSVRCLRD